MSKNQKPSKTKGLGAGIVAFGAVFALFSVVFHPHSIGAFLLAFALSGFAGAIVRTMGQGLDLTTHNREETPESLQKVQGNTGDPDVDALLQRGREMIATIRAENDLIPDSSLSEKLDQLEAKCAEVFRAVYDKPAKAPQIRKFMEYYLPTTLKMVKGYRMFDERGVSGAEAANAKKRIDEALGVVIKGCDKMLENLYRDDVLDITTDIDVLQQMLKRDGLTESELEKAAQQAREAARINAEADRMAAERARAEQQAQARREAEEAAKAAQALTPEWGMSDEDRRQMDAAYQASLDHRPQVPTMDGGMYPEYAQAAAQAVKPDNE